MSRLRIALAAVLAVSALAVLAVPATAAVPAANTAKFCRSMTGLSDKLGDVSPGDLSAGRSVLKKYASQLKAAAKNAPSGISSAARKLAGYYSALASGDYSGLQKNVTGIAPAALKLYGYLSDNCSGTTTTT